MSCLWAYCKHSITSTFHIDCGMFVSSIESMIYMSIHKLVILCYFPHESTVMVIPLHSFHPLSSPYDDPKYGLLFDEYIFTLHTSIYSTSNLMSSQRSPDKFPFCLSPVSPHVPPKIWHEHDMPQAPSPHSCSHSCIPDPYDPHECPVEVLKWCHVCAHAHGHPQCVPSLSICPFPDHGRAHGAAIVPHVAMARDDV